MDELTRIMNVPLELFTKETVFLRQSKFNYHDNNVKISYLINIPPPNKAAPTGQVFMNV